MDFYKTDDNILNSRSRKRKKNKNTKSILIIERCTLGQTTGDSQYDPITQKNVRNQQNVREFADFMWWWEVRGVVWTPG